MAVPSMIHADWRPRSCGMAPLSGAAAHPRRREIVGFNMFTSETTESGTEFRGGQVELVISDQTDHGATCGQVVVMVGAGSFEYPAPARGVNRRPCGHWPRFMVAANNRPSSGCKKLFPAAERRGRGAR